MELAALGRTDEAIEHYREALRIYPKDSRTLNNLGGLLAKVGRTDEAVPYLLRSVQSNPDYVGAHYNLFLAYRKEGKTDEALREYLTIRALDPNLADRLSGLLTEAR